MKFTPQQMSKRCRCKYSMCTNNNFMREIYENI